jgi:hypothetical protein
MSRPKRILVVTGVLAVPNSQGDSVDAVRFLNSFAFAENQDHGKP